MDKSIRSEKMALLCAMLRSARLNAGLRQEDVALSIGEPQSFVSKYESGERRLDLVELTEVCEALGLPVTDFVQEFVAADRRRRRRR